jgi:hypothetical protein
MDSCEAKGKWYWNALTPYIHYDCNPGCGNWCMKKDYHPNPPMYGARYGVYNATRKPDMASCGRRQTLWMTGNNGGLPGGPFLQQSPESPPLLPVIHSVCRLPQLAMSGFLVALYTP